jgi:hypothetical protein
VTGTRVVFWVYIVLTLAVLTVYIAIGAVGR